MQVLTSQIIALIFLLGFSCSKEPVTQLKDYKYLALGDSYTIGESVCETCRFPVQLTDSINEVTGKEAELRIIAQTGWTTANLLNAIEQTQVDSDYDLVSLLIGVNNQYQGQNFNLYEDQFPELVSKAIEFANSDTSKLIIVSIPDYAYTPFGQSTPNPSKISDEIDAYNNFAKCYADSLGIIFQDITDITRKGLENPDLVASDGLHPSGQAYSKFVSRLFEKAVNIID